MEKKAKVVNDFLSVQVISPQRIPATVAPFMLLSPSVFSQVKSSGGLPAVTQDNCPAPSTCPPQQEIRVLSRGQFQSTLLHLIQVTFKLPNLPLQFVSCEESGC